MRIPDDTSPKAWEVYWQRLREMSPAEKVNVGIALWEACYKTQRAAILHQNPDAGEDEIRYQIAARRFGAELARKVYRRT